MHISWVYLLNIHTVLISYRAEWMSENILTEFTRQVDWPDDSAKPDDSCWSLMPIKEDFPLLYLCMAAMTVKLRESSWWSLKKFSLWWDSNSPPPCYLNWMLALDVIAAESSNMNVIPRNAGLLEKPVINRSSRWFENGAKCEGCWGKWVVSRSLSSWKWTLVSEIRLATRTPRLVNHRIGR